MTGDVHVRALRQGDLDAVAALERAIYSNPWRREHFEQLLEMERAAGWVAEVAGALAGFAVACAIADEAELENIAVAESARGRGIARRLLDEVEAFAVRRGARRLYLDVREGNVAARALYETRGYGVVGRRRGYYTEPREDALTMVHELPVARRLTPRRSGS